MQQLGTSPSSSALPRSSCAGSGQQGCRVLRQRTLRAAFIRRTARLTQAAALACDKSVQHYTWPGHDEFDAKGDRQDKPPLSLPRLRTAKTVTLVRHGQSQWNAAGRIQGSCDLSLLTDKGRKQAEAARQQLEAEDFDAFFCSPLQRAAVTGNIIWARRRGSAQVLPALREVDLYSFQGLLKAEGKQRFGSQYHEWKHHPASLEIDGHAPVRELWHRASLALQSILAAEPGHNILVVAHNAVNQALICVALGLPPSAFRRLVQANAATTVLHFLPPAGQNAEASSGAPEAASAETRALLRHMNQSPEVVSNLAASGPPAGGVRIVLVACGSGSSGSSGKDVRATAGAVSAFQADELLCDDTPAAQEVQEAFLALERHTALVPQLWHPTRLPDEQLEAAAQERRSVVEALARFLTQSSPSTTGTTVAVVTSCPRAAVLMHHFCGLRQDAALAVEAQPASISCIDVAQCNGSAALADSAVVHCLNSCAHLGAGLTTAASAADGAGNASDS